MIELRVLQVQNFHRVFNDFVTVLGALSFPVRLWRLRGEIPRLALSELKNPTHTGLFPANLCKKGVMWNWKYHVFRSSGIEDA